MLVVFLPIFMVGTKIIFGYYFEVPLSIYIFNNISNNNNKNNNDNNNNNINRLFISLE